MTKDPKDFFITAALRLVDAGFPFVDHDVSTWTPSARLLPHALAVAAHAEGLRPVPERAGHLLNGAGLYLQRRARFPEAQDVRGRALAITEATYGPDHPEVGTDLGNLGLVLRALGDLQGAREHHERALAITQAAYGPDHPTVATMRANLESLRTAPAQASSC